MQTVVITLIKDGVETQLTDDYMIPQYMEQGWHIMKAEPVENTEAEDMRDEIATAELELYPNGRIGKSKSKNGGEIFKNGEPNEAQPEPKLFRTPSNEFINQGLKAKQKAKKQTQPIDDGVLKNKE